VVVRIEVWCNAYSQPVPNDMLAVSHGCISSHLEMRSAVGQQDPVTSFSDPSVSALIQQWRMEKRARLCTSQIYTP
jgi:hypothetical protein